MATTIEQVSQFLDDLELKHKKIEGMDVIAIGFGITEGTTGYRDHDGDPYVHLFLQIGERGEFLSVFSPRCWKIPDPDSMPAVSETLVLLQSQKKIVRFDFIEDTIFPNIELPLEDASLTMKLLKRVIHTLIELVHSGHRAIQHAIDNGTVLPELKSGDDEEFSDGYHVEASEHDAEEDESAEDQRPSARTSGDVMSLQDLVDEAGGLEGGAIERLQRLLGGEEAPKDGSSE